MAYAAYARRPCQLCKDAEAAEPVDQDSDERLGLARLLGGSWVVISGVISRVTVVITYSRGLIAPLITTHEPPSKAVLGLDVVGLGVLGKCRHKVYP